MPQALTFAEVQERAEAGAMIIDGRDPEEFARRHLAGAINVGLNGRYAEFAGSVVPFDVDIVLVVDGGFELEAKNRLARIGFDRPHQRPPQLGARHRRSHRRTLIHPGEGDTSTVRSVFIVDPANKIRLSLTYPKSVGRNFDEIVRVVDALQSTDAPNL